MTDQTPINTDRRLIDINDLSLSPLNTRQDVAIAEVEAMAHSLAANGLLQNLMAHETDLGLQIVGGGKRLRALQLIAATPATYPTTHTLNPVPVRVTADADVAREWAGAENEARSDPHPADQIRAYRDMAATGADPTAIARKYAQTETHVRGRLKLAQLPDTALTALQAGKINLDEAKALTLAGDPAQLDRVLEHVSTRGGGVQFIRRELSDGKIPATDRRVVFVGLETYTAEGGALTDDLFTDESLLHNEELLNTLFKTKLELTAEKVKAEEGWAWVTAVEEYYLPYSRHDHLRMIHPTSGELSESEEEDYRRLCEIEQDDALSPENAEMLEFLRNRHDGDFTDQDRENGGVFVYVQQNGDLNINRAYGARDTSGDASEINLDGEPPKTTKPTPPITGAGVADLHTIATLALQTVMVDKFELMLDLLTFQLETGMHAWQAPINLTITPQTIEPTVTDETTISPRLTAEPDTDDVSIEDQFANFRDLGRSHRNTVLCRHLTRGLNAPMHNDFSKSLMAELNVDLRKVWTPTAANLFSRCSVAMLGDLWEELLALEDDDPRRAEFGKLNKGQKAKELEALFSDASVQEAHGLSRDQVKAIDKWVPAEIRHSE